MASQAEVTVPEQQRNTCLNPKFESIFLKTCPSGLSRELLSHTSDLLIQLRGISNTIFSYHPATITGAQSNVVIPCPVIVAWHKGQAENSIMYWAQATGWISRLSLIPSLKQVTFSGGWAEKVIHATTFVFQQIAISCPKLNQKLVGSSHHFGSNFQTAWKRGKK